MQQNLYHTTLHQRNTDKLSELEPSLSYLYTTRIVRSYSWQIQGYERPLKNMNYCFLKQPGIYASQVQEAIEKIAALRNAALNTRIFLMEFLSPELTKILMPFGSVDKLSNLDFRIAELLAYLTLFRSIFSGNLCVDAEEITEIYLSLRKHSPLLLASFEDAVAQLVQFTKRASQAATQEAQHHA